MNAPIGWWWPAVAGVATVIALIATFDRPVAVVAATIAVVAAALTVVEVIARNREAREAEPEAQPVRVGGPREAFAGGAPGREDIVLTLDLLERKLGRPDLRARTPRELAELVQLPPEGFRQYVAGRLDELERTS